MQLIVSDFLTQLEYVRGQDEVFEWKKEVAS